jgi:hypothetical protein
MLAAVKAAGPDSWLSHVPGAMLVGILEAGIEVTPEVTVLGGSTRVIRGVRVHRTGALAPEDRWTWRGIPVLSPARLLLNLAGRLTGRPLRSAVRRAQGKNLVTVQQIVALLSRVGPLKGSRRLAQVVATGPAPTRSALEDVVLDLLLDGGFEPPDVNKPLMVDGQRIIPDFRWPEQRLIVEADGAAWHDKRVAREDDARKQAVLEAAGERLVRVTWEQAVLRRAQTVRRVEAAGAPRVASSA